jgi:hypothetical protein
MATQTDVRRIALSLPGAVEKAGRFAFEVENKGKLKGFVWVWMERVDPKKPRVPNPAVLAVRVATLGQKDTLISAEPRKFFTEPHYNGFPAILVRLAEVDSRDLRELITEAWRCMAPPAGQAGKAAKPLKASKPAKKKTTAKAAARKGPRR